LTEVANLCPRVVVLDRGRVLAVKDVNELTAATSGVRLELRLTGDPNAAATVLRGVAGVSEAEAWGGLVVVTGEGADLSERVSKAVVEAGSGLLELRATSTGTLEEAYLKLVRE